MLICILGLPGSGKSTLAKRLESRLADIGITPGAVSYLHPGRHAAAMGWVPKYPSRAQLAAVPHLTDSFMAVVEEALKRGIVITDGFPRTVEQARLLVGKKLDVVVVNLVFPKGKEVEMSIARQQKRIKDDGVIVPPSEVEEQTAFAFENDLPATIELVANCSTIIEVDALLSEAEVEEVVVKALVSRNGVER